MASYPAIHDPGILEKLLDVIETKTPPKTVDVDFLESAGLRRETDEQLMLLLEFLGYIDEDHHPAAIWHKSRDRSRAPGLMGSAVRAAYGSLFQLHPDAAETTDGTTLMSFFRERSGVDERTAAYMILTFKVLCDLSDFEAADREKAPVTPPVEETLPAEQEPPAEAAEAPSAETPGAEEPEEPVSGRVVLQLEVDVSADPELAGLVRRLLRRSLGEE